MASYTYTPLNLTEHVFRLLRLRSGKFADAIEGDLFEAWFPVSDGGMPYEALSYTWGTFETNATVAIDGRPLKITENLERALRHLRRASEDRILWVDGVCIDQGNVREHGHQARHMRRIYEEAERVVVWLGEATVGTDLAMDAMMRLQEGGVFVQGKWQRSAEFWKELSLVKGPIKYSAPELKDWHTRSWEEREPVLMSGVHALFERPWFRRIWVLQEVASARAAVIVCGQKSILSRVFSIVPTILSLPIAPQARAVLEVMPGPLRGESWLSDEKRLQTLLSRFKTCEASDPRDMIYALLGLSSDARESDALKIDYTKTLPQLLWDAAVFVLGDQHLSQYEETLPWTVESFIENLNSLSGAILRAFLARPPREWPQPVMQLLRSREDCDLRDELSMLTCSIYQGHEAAAKEIIVSGDFDINAEDSSGRTALTMAAAEGRQDVLALLVSRPGVDVNKKDLAGRSPLSIAASQGQVQAVQLLLSRSEIDVNIADNHTGRTPLMAAAESRHFEVVQLLLQREDLDVNATDHAKRTALMYTVTAEHSAIMYSLLSRIEIDTSIEDIWGRVPFRIAAGLPDQSVVKTMLASKHVDINLEDKRGWTALHEAACFNRPDNVIVMLSRKDIRIKLDEFDNSPLQVAVDREHLKIVELLLQHPEVDINLRNKAGSTPLSAAVSLGFADVVRLLLSQKNIDVNKADGRGLTPLSVAERLLPNPNDSKEGQSLKKIIDRQEIQVLLKEREAHI